MFWGGGGYQPIHSGSSEPEPAAERSGPPGGPIFFGVFKVAGVTPKHGRRKLKCPEIARNHD